MQASLAAQTSLTSGGGIPDTPLPTPTIRPLGPDGIPFLVWRRLRELGVTYLYEALKEMVSEGGVEKMRRDFLTSMPAC